MRYSLLLMGFYPLVLLADITPVTFSVCYDYECGSKQTVELKAEQWQHIKRLFSPKVKTPAQERRRIRQAIALMEQYSGDITGTSADLAENSEGAGTPGQMDCIDESTNSTTYLELFQQHGWLRWHTVESRIMRRRWLVAIHWTAVVRDTTTQQAYAVDSWFHANGQPPEIILLKDWQQGWSP